MARTVRDSALETRTGRLKLKLGQRRFKAIRDGLALSYRRTGAGFGTWAVRIRQANGKYALERLAAADDNAPANGSTVLDFAQAQRAAIARMSDVERAGGIVTVDRTVAEAVEHYLQWFRANRKGVRETEWTIRAHILPAFGSRTLASLKTVEIRQWHGKLAAKPARVRSGIGRRVAYKEVPATDDAKRARKSTANRNLTVFKAILNKAFDDEMVGSRDAWARVKPFKNVEQPVIRFLTGHEATRLVNACDPDLRMLVRGALLTGARFGELAGLGRNDVSARSIFIRPSKSDKGRHVPLNDEGARFFAEVTAGQTGAECVFVRADGSTWGHNVHVRGLLQACTRARIAPAITFHDLRHTYASLLAQAGADLLTISKLLGHSDTRVTARHYAHLCEKTLANAVNKLLPSFGAEPSNVRPIAA